MTSSLSEDEGEASEFSDYTTTREFLEHLMKYINKSPEDAEPYIKKLEDEWVNTVQLLNQIKDNEWDNYDLPMGLVKLIRLHMTKINFKLE